MDSNSRHQIKTTVSHRGCKNNHKSLLTNGGNWAGTGSSRRGRGHGVGVGDIRIDDEESGDSQSEEFEELHGV